MNDLYLLDQHARNQALDPTNSFIVQAPAGSGKTELLIQRFLCLLSHVQKPEEILAITFTKKAANEMRARIIKALKSAEYDVVPESSHAKKTWQLAKNALSKDKASGWNLIQNPNQLRIQTIDSFCNYLANQMPILSDLGANATILLKPNTLYLEAVNEVLTHLEENFEWSDAIAQLLLHLDNDLNKLQRLLVRLLQKRDQWLSYIQFNLNDSDIKKNLEKQLRLVIEEHLIQLKNFFPSESLTRLLPICRYTANHLVIRKAESPIIHCHDLIRIPNASCDDFQIWKGIATLLLTKSFQWRKRVDEDIGFPKISELKNVDEKFIRAELAQELINEIITLNTKEELRLALQELFYLPNLQYSKEQWDILSALLHLLKVTLAQLKLTFQQHGKIDFIENTQAALRALGDDDNPTDLALALDYQIKHLLIDEFQDTSTTQYLLLQKLVQAWELDSGRSLFIVGDPMQSIYRFREAEVGLFIRLFQHGLPHFPLTPLRLTVNFRSSAQIVNWNNAHFQYIFPKQHDLSFGAVEYSQSITNKKTELDSEVCIQGFVGSDVEHYNAIIELIQKTLTQFKEERIAILVRSRTHLIDLIPRLKKANICYRAIDIDVLETRQIVQDLFSLTAAFLHLSDRIAWLSILRAPWCGLSLADLLQIAGGNAQKSIWEKLKHYSTLNLTDDGKQRLTRIVPILAAKLNERGREPLRQWIENTWLLLGGPTCLENENELADANTYFNLLQHIDTEKNALTRFDLKKELSMLYASNEAPDAQVDIMTIHSAKGLEFETVILPHLERKMLSDDKELLAWLEQPLSNNKNALLLAPINATGTKDDAMFKYITRCEQIKSTHEISRLLYVATTRAKKRLYLLFNLKKTEDNVKVESGSFLHELWPMLVKKQDEIISASNDDSNHEEKKIRPVKRLKKDWINPITYNAKTLIYHNKSLGFKLKNALPQKIGTVTHQILQCLSEKGIAWWQQYNKNLQNQFITNILKMNGVLPHQLSMALTQIQQMISNTIQDQRGAWILNASKFAKTEYAITAYLNQHFQQLIIDKTFVDNEDARWIVDYKTTTFNENDLELFLLENQEKYLEKMLLYAQALRLIENRKIKLGLYFPALVAWKEWDAVEN